MADPITDKEKRKKKIKALPYTDQKKFREEEMTKTSAILDEVGQRSEKKE